MSKKRQILIFNNTGSYIYRFRLELIEQLIKSGYMVAAAFPFDGYERQLKKRGVKCFHVPLDGYSTKITLEFKSLRHLRSLLKKNNFDVLLCFTIKPILYASVCSFFLNVKIISTITGRGRIYTRTGFSALISKIALNSFYKFALMRSSIVFFQNNDDRLYFLKEKVISNSKTTRLVPGSGINLSKFRFKQRSASSKPSFVMVSRLLPEKGVTEYCRAAAYIKKQFNVDFTLVGSEPAHSETRIDGLKLKEFCENSGILYLGYQKSIPEILSSHTVFVLPSHGGEGTPRSILEALSTGMPIVTTNVPGAKDTVHSGKNGYLVEPKSCISLKLNLEKIIHEWSNIPQMSLNSYELAKSKFDVKFVTSKYVREISHLTSLG